MLSGRDDFIAVADGCLMAPGYPPLPSDRLGIIGSKATLIMDYDRVFLVGQEQNAVQIDLLGRYQECFTHAIGDFVSGITTGAAFETDRLDNLETLKLMEQCYQVAGVAPK